MAASEIRNDATGPRGRAGTALIVLATLAALAIWWLVVLPVLDGTRAAQHVRHFGHVVLHAAGGTLMLFVGALALFVGWTRRWFRWHAWIGRVYLIGGGIGAGMGLYLSIVGNHPLPGVGTATGVLAATWLSVAAMAWRAARNRRFDSHRQWMVRSYVLTWTFVACRIVMLGAGDGLAAPASIVAVIWASWIVPLVVCEIALQWRAGAALRGS